MVARVERAAEARAAARPQGPRGRGVRRHRRGRLRLRRDRGAAKAPRSRWSAMTVSTASARAAEEIGRRFGVAGAARRRQHRGPQERDPGAGRGGVLRRPRGRADPRRGAASRARRRLLVVADVNAVPPLGVEGLDVNADGVPDRRRQCARHRRAGHRADQVPHRVRPVPPDDRSREAGAPRFPRRLRAGP